MNLGNEIHEWRKQMTEKLLLNGMSAENIESRVNAAENIVYGDQVATITIECPLKFAAQLKATLLEFSQKNGCFVTAKD